MTILLMTKQELIKEAKESTPDAKVRMPGRYGSSLVLREGRRQGNAELYYLNSRTLAESFASFVLLTEGLRVSVERVGFQYLVGVEDNRLPNSRPPEPTNYLELFNASLQGETKL